MFAVLYRWRVIPGMDAQFEARWKRVTAAIAPDGFKTLFAMPATADLLELERA